MRSGEISAATLGKITREAYFVPSGTPLFSQLQLFQENRERVGLIVDEYGEWMGLVTLDDIVEEIIGEFTTHAPSHAAFIKQENGSIIVEGSSLLRDLNRKLGLSLPLGGPRRSMVLFSNTSRIYLRLAPALKSQVILWRSFRRRIEWSRS